MSVQAPQGQEGEIHRGGPKGHVLHAELLGAGYAGCCELGCGGEGDFEGQREEMTRRNDGMERKEEVIEDTTAKKAAEKPVWTGSRSSIDKYS